MSGLARKIVSLLSAVLAFPLLFLLRYAGVTDRLFRMFSRRGFYLFRKHYYLPVPDDDDVRLQAVSGLAGIDMNDAAQLRFTDEVILPYKAEFSALAGAPPGGAGGYRLVNGTFMAGDGHAYYAMIRHLRPRRIIEVGAGNSTLLAARALRRNGADSPGYSCRFIAVEPYPSDELAALPGLTELKTCKVQEAGLDLFRQLGPGDILFIDSSHVLKSGGDVWWLYCEVLPRLQPGVYVHVHDISLPRPYPSAYLGNHYYWNEQYLLQALLTGNKNLEVVWAGTYLFDKYGEEMVKKFSPEYGQMRAAYPDAEPTSFWFRIRRD